jgi:hypothetical protein
MQRSVSHAIGLAVLVVALGGTAAAQPCGTPFDCNPSFDPCTVVGCESGQCTFTPRDCSDGLSCTADRCDPTFGCVHEPQCPDDGLVCNGAPLCLPFPFGGFLCLPPTPLDCDTHSRCSIDSCVEPTGCQHVPVDCGDGNPCTVDTCDPVAGCLHVPILGCCTRPGDCPTDACSTRDCVAHVCTDPTPISCDDGDPSTTDACNPATGCTHTSVSATTTTTTVPGSGSACGIPADCAAPVDPCLEATCTAGRCGTRRLVGFAGLACICRRPAPAACAGESYPRKLARHAAQACALIDRTGSASGPKRERLLRKAIRQLVKAERAASQATARGSLTSACGNAASAELMDDVGRADAIRGGS